MTSDFGGSLASDRAVSRKGLEERYRHATLVRSKHFGCSLLSCVADWDVIIKLKRLAPQVWPSLVEGREW